MKQLIYLLLLFSSSICAQTFEWLNVPEIQSGMNAQNMGYATACDPDGNVWFTGFRDHGVVGNDLLGDIYLNKYSAAGELLISKTITGKTGSYHIITDRDGNVLLALAYEDILAIDGGVEVNDEDMEPHQMLIKFNSEGNYLWSQEMLVDDPDFPQARDFRGLYADASGNVYTAYDDYGTSYISKYSAGGMHLLTVKQQHVNRITSVAVDTEGNIYGAGSCAGPESVYAGVEAGTTLQYNTYIVKYSSEGIFQWVKYIEDITCPDPRVVVRTPEEVYFSSWLYANEGFDPVAIEGPGEFATDFFIAKLNENGAFQWVREVPGEGEVGPGNRNYLTIDDGGNVYFTGYTRGTINWGNGITTATSGFNYDGIVLKYSPQGELLMAKTAGGDSEDRFDGVAAGLDGNVYITGMSVGTVHFDDLEHTGDSEWDFFPYIAKITMDALGTENPVVKDKITLHPNPASDYLYISGIDGRAKATIVNMLGQRVMTFEAGSGPVSISGMPAGTYFIHADGYKALRFVKK